MLRKALKSLMVFTLLGWGSAVFGQNQTTDLSPVYTTNHLPYDVQIDIADFALPSGIHSGISGSYNGQWVFLAGRTNGMHNFNNDPNNFPPSKQNTTVHVVNLNNQTVSYRSLTDPSSGLTQHQIDLLSVTAPQFYQWGNTLYMTGGYGVDTATGEFSTKDVLTAIDVPGLIHWVTNPYPGETAAEHIRQLSNPVFQVTGGWMAKAPKQPTLLIYGQDFEGFYFDPTTTGVYTQQVRRFHIHDDGINLGVKVLNPLPAVPNPNYRRRDLNVVPIMQNMPGNVPYPAHVAFSGVFTLTDGAWTVPVMINAAGESSMANPNRSSTFKQAMNNYKCAYMGLFSKDSGTMYSTFFGGITFGYFLNGQFQTDPELPFTNQVTTIKLDKHGHFKQYLMNGEYPTILSTQSNPGNPLLFGAGALFIPANGISLYDNGVVKLDSLGSSSVVIGYIVGGIQSTLPNTNVPSDSAASPYIFQVTLLPK